MIKYLLSLITLILFSCSGNRKSIEEVKQDFGDFGDKSIKLIPVDYTKIPVYNTIKHHPENFEFLKKVDIHSMAHISDGLFITGLMVTPKKR